MGTIRRGASGERSSARGGRKSDLPVAGVATLLGMVVACISSTACGVGGDEAWAGGAEVGDGAPSAAVSAAMSLWSVLD